MHHYERFRQQGRPSYNIALELSCRKAWVGRWSHNMDDNVAQLENKLAAEAKLHKARGLQQWRQTMKAAGKGATAWLSPTLQVLPTAVCYRNSGGDLV